MNKDESSQIPRMQNINESEMKNTGSMDQIEQPRNSLYDDVASLKPKRLAATRGILKRIVEKQK